MADHRRPDEPRERYAPLVLRQREQDEWRERFPRREWLVWVEVVVHLVRGWPLQLRELACQLWKHAVGDVAVPEVRNRRCQVAWQHLVRSYKIFVS